MEEDFDMPPWYPSSDETVAADQAQFQDCQDFVRSISSGASQKVNNESYWLSKTWGRILRAEITDDSGGFRTTSRVVCWSDFEHKVRIWVMAAGNG